MGIRICLDAGHDGKYNQSNVVPAYYESDFNWKLYIRLKKYLEEYGIEVIGTRASQNTQLGLNSRGKCSKGYDAFFSLHANAAERESADHVVIYEMVNKKSHSLAVVLAEAIQNTMNPIEKYDIRTKANNNGGEWYGVLSGCAQVGNENGFIVEHSFYTNKAMATWMMDDNNIDKLAQNEANAIAKYYGLNKKEENTSIVEIEENDLVSIKNGAVYTTGANVPSWVVNQNWYVKSVSGDVVIIDQNEPKTNSINSPINKNYLEIVKKANTTVSTVIDSTPKTELELEPEIEVKPTLTEELEPVVLLETEEQTKEEIKKNTSSMTFDKIILKFILDFILVPLTKWINNLLAKE